MFVVQLKSKDRTMYVSNLASQDVSITDKLEEAGFCQKDDQWRLDRYRQLSEFGIESSWIEVDLTVKQNP